MKLPAEGWEAFYINGETYDSKFYNWSDIPSNGLLVVIIWHEYHMPGLRKKTLLHDDYYYYIDADNWGCTNDTTFLDGLEPSDIKLGEWTTDVHMNVLYRTAFEKLDF